MVHQSIKEPVLLVGGRQLSLARFIGFLFAFEGKHAFNFNFLVPSVAGNIHFLLRWNLCFKRHTRTLSIFNFRKSKGDFHMIAIILDSNTKFSTEVLLQFYIPL